MPDHSLLFSYIFLWPFLFCNFSVISLSKGLSTNVLLAHSLSSPIINVYTPYCWLAARVLKCFFFFFQYTIFDSFSEIANCTFKWFRLNALMQKFYRFPKQLLISLRNIKNIVSTFFTLYIKHFWWMILLEACKMKNLLSPYHGFLKMTVHMVWNIALREWKHPAKIYIW